MIVVIININYCAQTELRTAGGQLFLSGAELVFFSFHFCALYNFDQPEVDSGLVVVWKAWQSSLLYLHSIC